MKILLVSDLNVGGIETLIIRFLRFLKENGHQPTLYIIFGRYNNGLLYQAQAVSEVRILNRKPYFLGSPIIDDNQYDIIMSFSIHGFLHSLLIRNQKKAKYILGIYASLEYAWHSSPQGIRQKIMMKILQDIPSNNIISMNREFLKKHEEVTNITFPNASIIPLPVDVKKYSHVLRNPKHRKIVSIGRLEKFKTYNFHMINIISDLQSNGFDTEFHIYGDGNCRKEIEALINKYELKDKVYLHGRVEYENFSSVLSDAYIFVGMGTALIEAAACGVPSIIAIDRNKSPTTFGFFHLGLDYNIGERNKDKPTFLITDAIKSSFLWSSDEYDSASRLSRERAELFSGRENFQKYIDAFEAAIFFQPKLRFLDKFLDFIDMGRWFVKRLLGQKTPYDRDRYSIEN